MKWQFLSFSLSSFFEGTYFFIDFHIYFFLLFVWIKGAPRAKAPAILGPCKRALSTPQLVLKLFRVGLEPLVVLGGGGCRLGSAPRERVLRPQPTFTD